MIWNGFPRLGHKCTLKYNFKPIESATFVWEDHLAVYCNFHATLEESYSNSKVYADSYLSLRN